MSLDQTYSDDNIFARIIRGELPCAKIYEDDKTLAFMDAFPQTRGHSLVICKDSRAVNLLDMPTDALGRLLSVTQKVARATVAALAPDGFKIVQFNGDQAGQTVYHLHFHIIPVYTATPEGGHTKGQAEMADLQNLAEKIRAEL
ncbi:MAG: HIT family protein [Pseudomonadota bacterium]